MDMFVTVPQTILPGGRVVPAFRVGQYVCTKGPKGKAAVTAEGAPWVTINFEEAKAACAKAGYALITESQALAIAYQVAAQRENWTGFQVGKGKLRQGLRKWSVESPQPGNVEPKDTDENRWFYINRREALCDVAGNVYTWVFDDIQGDKNGLIATPFKADSPSLVIPFPDDDKGQGWTPRPGANWSGRALIRGGCWGSGGVAGAFYLGYWPDYRNDSVGFRCTTQLVSDPWSQVAAQP